MSGKIPVRVLIIGLLVLSVLYPGLGQAAPAVSPIFSATPQPVFGPVLFSSDFDLNAQQPVNVSNIFPAGTTILYAYWAYSGVEAGLTFAFEWYRNGNQLAKDQTSFTGPVGYAWQTYSPEDGQPLQPGIYEFVVRVLDTVVIHEQCLVEGPREEGGDRPAFSYVTFSSGFNEQAQRPHSTGWSFPYGITRLYAYWPYSEARPGETFTYEWFFNGEPMSSGEDRFVTSSNFFRTAISYSSGEPLDAGSYQLVVKIGGRQVALRDDRCVIGGGPFFGPAAFSSRFDDAAEEPVDAGRVLPADTFRLYAYWPYGGVRAGDVFDYEWYRNGEPFQKGPGGFNTENGYAWQWVYHTDGTPLVAGIYQFFVKVGGRVVIADQAVIQGAAPASQAAQVVASKPSFGPLVFSSAFDPGTQTPLNPALRFDYGITALYGYWQFQNVRPGDVFRYEWYHNGVFREGGEDSFGDVSGYAWQWFVQPDGTALDPGAYQLAVTLNGVRVLAGSASIWLPDLPDAGPYGYGY